MLRVDSLPTISMAAPFANDRSFKEKVSLRNPSFDAASFKADPTAAGTSFFFIVSFFGLVSEIV